ncbi:guanine-N(7)--methyltransferase-like protein [Neocallimastix californiae]|jgi:tRNA (guanine-N7-)-methyltransferase|uniref:tRNA (guanine-N(7)-)-methyltransferase n=1 Tax=Neocallimastix californiae TaxID=1754190 RepID=A0A1Y2AZ64_9FUNG|nr:guanine-N(7)--methyltransferase-like protein [Neocallimastix californiae]|eukprot:ORY27527.1 guanine-N(7)--methyltransferase-like protein [Neocallimastix californiae]
MEDSEQSSNKRQADVVKLPRKRFFRQRAHANPFSDHDLIYPIKPDEMDWSPYFPRYFSKDSKENTKKVDFIDVGCGYGGLLVALAPLFPDKLILGMEIRTKVEDYVKKRIIALRNQSKDDLYQNISVIRMNAMKFLPNFFEAGQLSKMFFLFPDPHFKRKKHKNRIISPNLLAEYAYLLKVGGLLYTATDVRELHEWMVEKCDAHPLFERIPDEELKDDPCINCILNETEEGKKVARNNGDKHFAVYRRIENN